MPKIEEMTKSEKIKSVLDHIEKLGLTVSDVFCSLEIIGVDSIKDFVIEDVCSSNIDLPEDFK